MSVNKFTESTRLEIKLGGRLRRLRQERRLSQVQMAEQLGISPSYLNLLEHSQRPVTVPVLLKLAQRFAVDLQQFSTDDDERLVSDLMEAFADPIFDGQSIKAMELARLPMSLRWGLVSAQGRLLSSREISTEMAISTSQSPTSQTTQLV